MKPLIELSTPVQVGDSWVAHARIHLATGVVTIEVAAPQALAARAMARAQAAFTGALSVRSNYAAGPIARTVQALEPYAALVRPLAPRGVRPETIALADRALRLAQTPTSQGAQMRAAIDAQANAARNGDAQARAVNQVVSATAKARAQGGDAGVLALRGYAAAKELVRASLAGDPGALYVAEQFDQLAVTGTPQAVVSSALLTLAEKELEKEGARPNGMPSSSRWPVHPVTCAVGALARSRPNGHFLAARLQALRARRRDVRRIAA